MCHTHSWLQQLRSRPQLPTMMIPIITFWPPRPLALTMVKRCWNTTWNSQKTPIVWNISIKIALLKMENQSVSGLKRWWLSTFFHPIPRLMIGIVISENVDNYGWPLNDYIFWPIKKGHHRFTTKWRTTINDSLLHIHHSLEVEREYKQVHNNLKCRDVCCTLQVETLIFNTTRHTFDFDLDLWIDLGLWPWPQSKVNGNKNRWQNTFYHCKTLNFEIVQSWKRRWNDRQTDRCYQVHYLPALQSITKI